MLPWLRRVATLAVALATVALAAGCSDDDPTGSTASADRSTATVADASSTSVPAEGDDPAAPDATTDATSDATADAPEPPIDPSPPQPPGASTSLLEASSGLPDELIENSRGEKIRLDETALLACANNQMAWVALRTGDGAEAARVLGIAAQRAEASAVAEVKAAAAELGAAAEGQRRRAVVDDFLELCVDRGFEY